jgi:hypothetical protein
MVFLTLAEIMVFCLAGFVFFRDRGNTLAEAGSYAVVSTLMLLSFICQLALVIHAPVLSFVVEAGLLVWAIFSICHKRLVLTQTVAVMQTVCRNMPLMFWVVMLGCCYLGALAILIPPGISYWKSLGRMLLFQRHGLFSPVLSTGFSEPLFSINHAVLANMFLRFGTDMGVGIFGFLAYLSIACSTYALSRRYSWPPTALTVTILVAGMPRLVFHASSPGNEIIPAAAGLFCLLAAYRSVERLNTADFFLLGMGCMFSISDGMAGVIFPMILLVLVWMLLVRRHGAGSLWSIIRANRRWALTAFVPAAVFSQVWLFSWNLIHHERWTGTSAMSPLSFNLGGLQGSLANFMRYLLEGVHATLPVDRFFVLMFRSSFSEILERTADVMPGFLSGKAGLGEAFFIAWEPNEIYSWFGPFALILAAPAIVYAFCRGPRSLKMISVALAGHVYLMTVIFAWSPGNARLFTVVFVCSGFFMAFFLPPWRFGRGGKLALQWVGLFLFFYALIFNTIKPMVPIGRIVEAELLQSIEAPILKAKHFDTIERKNIWLKTKGGRDRLAEAKDYFGDHRVTEGFNLLEKNARIGYVTDNLFYIYPYILARPDTVAAIFSSEKINLEALPKFEAVDAMLCFDVDSDLQEKRFSLKKVWPKNAKGVVAVRTALLKKRQPSENLKFY